MARTAPHRFVSKVRKPKDFDAFWLEVLEEAAKVPLAPKTVAEPLRSSDDIEVFQAFYNSLDNVRVAGWYCLPRKRPAKVPGILAMPGYNSDPSIPKEWARRGYAALMVAPRGKLRSRLQFDPGYPGLLTHNIVDHNTYGYRGFFVDAWKGIDYLLNRPEVDASSIGVTGSSQGGGLTLTTAAIRPEVRAASASAPYLCGITDAIDLTQTYPYQEINDYLRLHPESTQDVHKTLSYFDGINFADRISCPILVNIGLQDNTCPPETGFAVFRSIGSEDKKLYTFDKQGHDAGRHEHEETVEEFFKAHLGP